MILNQNQNHLNETDLNQNQNHDFDFQNHDLIFKIKIMPISVDSLDFKFKLG